jgi:hypothetical protein
LVTSRGCVNGTVATGHYEQCAGLTLQINGWLDEHHLVYRNSMNYYILDARIGTIAQLFNETEMPLTFTW